MAAVTICSDFRTPQNKVSVSIVSPSIYHEVMGLDATILVLCDYGFHSVCPLMDKDKKLMKASLWERLPEGETGSCSDGRGHAP